MSNLLHTGDQKFGKNIFQVLQPKEGSGKKYDSILFDCYIK